jgi:hypothetical protein
MISEMPFIWAVIGMGLRMGLWGFGIILCLLAKKESFWYNFFKE